MLNGLKSKQFNLQRPISSCTVYCSSPAVIIIEVVVVVVIIIIERKESIIPVPWTSNRIRKFTTSDFFF